MHSDCSFRGHTLHGCSLHDWSCKRAEDRCTGTIGRARCLSQHWDNSHLTTSVHDPDDFKSKILYSNISSLDHVSLS